MNCLSHYLLKGTFLMGFLAQAGWEEVIGEKETTCTPGIKRLLHSGAAVPIQVLRELKYVNSLSLCPLVKGKLLLKALLGLKCSTDL